MLKMAIDMIVLAKDGLSRIFPGAQSPPRHQMELVRSIFTEAGSVERLSDALKKEIASSAHLDAFPRSIDCHYVVSTISAIAVNWFSAADLSVLSRQLATYLQLQQVMRGNFKLLFVELLHVVDGYPVRRIGPAEHQAVAEFLECLVNEMLASTYIDWMFPPG